VQTSRANYTTYIRMVDAISANYVSSSSAGAFTYRHVTPVCCFCRTSQSFQFVSESARQPPSSVNLHGCETWSLIRSEEFWMRMSEIKTAEDEVIKWRRLDMFHNLLTYIMLIKSSWMRWAENVARMWRWQIRTIFSRDTSCETIGDAMWVQRTMVLNLYKTDGQIHTRLSTR
jgi:hypothetical protein